jgi:hypothetical protein
MQRSVFIMGNSIYPKPQKLPASATFNILAKPLKNMRGFLPEPG